MHVVAKGVLSPPEPELPRPLQSPSVGAGTPLQAFCKRPVPLENVLQSCPFSLGCGTVR